jgi:hypothetical protein
MIENIFKTICKLHEQIPEDEGEKQGSQE